MLYIFEMANNHQGSVSHAKKIIDDFADLAKRYNLNAGVKLQFRNLDTFIHNKFKDSDLKYVKRFNDTKLSKEQFGEIVNYIKSKGLLSVSTPFDNESLPLFDDLGVEVLKIASCSVDDWPLLEEVSNINRKIIISTGGATNVVVNVDASGSSVEGDENRGRQLGQVLSAAIQAELVNQKRPGGLLA